MKRQIKFDPRENKQENHKNHFGETKFYPIENNQENQENQIN